MRNLLLTKDSDGRLAPWDAASADYLERQPVGRMLAMKAKRARMPKHHRFTMALISALWKGGVIEASSMDSAIEIAKFVVGFVEPRRLPSGAVHLVPKSISFAAADEDDYRTGFAEPLRDWARRQLDDISDAELRTLIQELT